MGERRIHKRKRACSVKADKCDRSGIHLQQSNKFMLTNF